MLTANRLACLLHNRYIWAELPPVAGCGCNPIRRKASEATLDPTIPPTNRTEKNKIPKRNPLFYRFPRNPGCGWLRLDQAEARIAEAKGRPSAIRLITYGRGAGSDIEEGNSHRYYPVPICCLISVWSRCRTDGQLFLRSDVRTSLYKFFPSSVALPSATLYFLHGAPKPHAPLPVGWYHANSRRWLRR